MMPGALMVWHSSFDFPLLRCLQECPHHGRARAESPDIGAAGVPRAWDCIPELVWIPYGLVRVNRGVRPGKAQLEDRSGANVWGSYGSTWMRMCTCPSANPPRNYWGGDRKGANLYGTPWCGRRADRKTQMVLSGFHHDTWDYDFASPGVFDVIRNAARSPLSRSSKMGLLLFSDRVTGSQSTV